jgi:pimeloyl-ACP methyl ester carboxylesterase
LLHLLERVSLPLTLGLTLVAGTASAAGLPASDFLDCHGVKIHYVVEGVGEPVILLHGLYSSAAINWQLTGVFSKLAKDHRVIALDLPGHGRSDKPENEAAYGLAIIDDVVALLDELQVKQAHVVGYSLGG